jgi:hypothetical protein
VKTRAARAMPASRTYPKEQYVNRCKQVISATVLVMGMAVVAQGQPAQQPQGQQPTPENVDEYVRLVREGVQKDKTQIIGAALELDATQAAAFWPVYKQYEAELLAIADKRYAAIKSYAGSYGSLTDAKATELIDAAIGLEEQRLALIKRYLGEFRKVIPAVKVGRWYQAEMGLNRIVDVRLAAELPLLK